MKIDLIAQAGRFAKFTRNGKDREGHRDPQTVEVDGDPAAAAGFFGASQFVFLPTQQWRPVARPVGADRP